jgi:hypothetical protein
MRLRQPVADLDGHVEGLLESQRTPRDRLPERLALVVGHHEIELAVGRLIDLVDGADIGMVERRGGPRLPQKPLLGPLITREVRREHFDRHDAVEARIAGPVHRPHAAGPEWGNDFVRAEASANTERHVA